MKYLLPPLHTLRAFEAIARLGSFGLAAQELHLTHSAISHQIRALEAFFALRLIARTRHNVTLTPPGEQLLTVVRGNLEQLSQVSVALRNGDTRRLSISVLPSFASRWLLPRLGQFLQAHPDIDLQIHATQALIDLQANAIDVAIRYGKGNWPNTRSEHLADEVVFPVASPALIASRPIKQAQDLQRHTLLRDECQPWEPWLAQTGITASTCTFGALYGDSALSIQSAETGQGIALARSWLVDDALHTGKLVRIDPSTLPANGAYYLTFPKHKTAVGVVALFCDWLKVAMQVGR